MDPNGEILIMCVYNCIYIYMYTIWLFNHGKPWKTMEKHGKSQFLIGKPSISMGHGFHGYVK